MNNSLQSSYEVFNLLWLCRPRNPCTIFFDKVFKFPQIYWSSGVDQVFFVDVTDFP